MQGNSRSAGRWIGETLSNRGAFGAFRYYVEAILDLARDLTPTRRKSRYGDIDFDFAHGVDTTWANISLRTRLRELLSEGQYQPSEPALFHEIIEAIPADINGFTYIDLGSGKGRTLLMASDYRFNHIVGVELLEELHEIAVKNVLSYRSEQQQCFNVDAQAGDARDFVFPAGPTVLYLFNPFPEHVLRAVLSNLENSVRAAPREVYVIYHNLIHEDVFTTQSWLQRIHRTHQFAIYKASPGAR